MLFDEPRAKWLPSRRRFALARLMALIAFRAAAARPKKVERVVYAIDRDHDQLENYAMSLWIAITMFAYTASALPLRPVAAAVAALVLLPMMLQIPFYTGPVLIAFAAGDNRRFASRFYLSVIVAASAYFARAQSSVRYVAWFFLGVCALNALAAVIMFFARGVVAQMEAECGL